MKTRNLLQAITFVAICGLALSSQAQLVSNTFNTGSRDYPAAPVYSEMGVDSNTSGDLESAWFVGGSGALYTVPGTMTMSNDAVGSSTYTTYFAPEGSEVTLASAGDTLKVTWVFTPHGVNSSNTSQGFPIAIVNSPGASMITNDTAPGSAIYAGYSMNMNMGNTVKNGNPFLLREWGTPGASSAMLSSSGAWANLWGGGYGSPILSGYVDGTEYTFMMQFTLLTGGDLEIASSMMGGTLNGGAGFSLVYTDSTPNSLSFDTFSVRPSKSISTADTFDTTLFQVDTNVIIPEPSTIALVGAGLGLMFAMIRRRRRS